MLPLKTIALVLICSGLAACRDEATHHETGTAISVTGQLVDTRCFALDSQNTGPDHVLDRELVPKCAKACAKQGLPVAVLSGEDDLWVLVTVPQILADYMAETVQVDGTVRSAGVLIPERVQLKQGDSWVVIM